jgi:hypothetical protein
LYEYEGADYWALGVNASSGLDFKDAGTVKVNFQDDVVNIIGDLKIKNAAGTVKVCSDVANNYFGIGTATPGFTLHLVDASRFTMSMEDTSITNIPFTTLATASTIGKLNQYYTSNGGLALQGLTYGNYSAFVFDGHVGTTTPTVAALNFRGWKLSGTDRTAMTGSEIIASFLPGAGSSVMDVKVSGVDIVGLLDVNNDKIRLRTAKTPASAGATGNAGDICWDADYIYVCVATNTWKRVAIASW